MDAVRTGAPLPGALVDLGLLLLLALLDQSMSRGRMRNFLRWSIPPRLERSTQAWAAAAMLGLIYAAWQPLPQILWNATGPLLGVLSGLSYLAWTLILIATFLACQLEAFEILGGAGAASLAVDGGRPQTESKVPLSDTVHQPLCCAILVVLWATSQMTVGHLLLATAVIAYLLFGAVSAVLKTSATLPRPAFSFHRKRVAR
jgi:methanethiol S-methyltransferase